MRNIKPQNEHVKTVSISLDPDILDMFKRIPDGERSRTINDILRRNLPGMLVRRGVIK